MSEGGSPRIWIVVGATCLARVAALTALGLIPAVGQAAPSATAHTAAKLEPYIECLNTVSQTVIKSHGWYLRWVDAEKGPSGKEPRGPVLQRLWGI